MYIYSYFNNGSNVASEIYHDEPSECPICRHTIKPIQLAGNMYETSEHKRKIVFLYLCPSCYNAFICQYNNIFSSHDNSVNRFVYKSNDTPIIGPMKFKPKHFNEVITKISNSFTKIYNEALQAENLDLGEIAGIGYRKALEFLIKDFLILKYQDNKENIEKAPLGTCINNYIDNPQLKTVASRAVWLGNDQTHYIQKFTDKDINDLKKLISLTVHWISMILETEEASTIEPIK